MKIHNSAHCSVLEVAMVGSKGPHDPSPLGTYTRERAMWREGKKKEAVISKVNRFVIACTLMVVEFIIKDGCE